MITDPIFTAARLAFACFEGHRRTGKYGKPYVTHCCELAGLVATRPWATVPLVAGSFTHDNGEDDKTGEFGLPRVRSDCGEETYKVSWWLTKPSSYTENQHLSKEQKLAMDLAHLAQAPWQIKSIKALDRFLNISDMVRDRVSATRARNYVAETEALLPILAEADSWCLQQVQDVLPHLRELALAV